MSSGLALPPPLTITAPTGTATLHLVELDRAAVMSPRKQIRLRKGSKKHSEADCSFGDFDSSELKVDAWPFFHAAKKTELATTYTSAQVDRRALSYAAEYADVFVWNAGNLRRVDRSVFALEDFSDAGLAGRFGEAIAYLAMHSWGYKYFDRISVLWERAASLSGMTHPEQVQNAQILASKLGVPRPDLEPDFAFEKASGDVALMESKGSFVHPTNDNPSTKNDLRHALDQLAAWSGMIAPTPAKSYAIGTYFRDKSDASGDPSLVTYVDPPGRRDAELRPVEFRRDLIRRGNYGSWLVGMGFSVSGNALRASVELRLPERRMPVVSIGGREYALAIERVLVNPSRFPFDHFWTMQLLNEMFVFGSHTRVPSHFWQDMGIDGFQVLGIDTNILHQAEESLVNSASMSLLEAEELNPEEPLQSRMPDNNYISGSIFADGAYYGVIAPNLFYDARKEPFRI